MQHNSEIQLEFSNNLQHNDDRGFRGMRYGLRSSSHPFRIYEAILNFGVESLRFLGAVI